MKMDKMNSSSCKIKRNKKGNKKKEIKKKIKRIKKRKMN